MLHSLARRAVIVAVTVLAVSVIIFVLVELMPGDVARMILGQHATPEAIEALRDQLGLDTPAYVRYFSWLGGALKGDFGTSLYLSGVQIGPLVLRRAINSVVLCVFALALFVPVSLGLGILSALHEGGFVDSFIRTSGLFALSLPEFVNGIVLILLFSLGLHWLPSSSNLPVDASPFSSIQHLVLPVISISLVMFGYVARMARASMISVLRADYTRTAILKGLPKYKVVWKHSVPNALLPAITVIGMNIGWLFGGLVVVETLFGYPGVGSLMVSALRSRDVPLIEAIAVLVTLAYVVSNLGTDVIYGALNPQLRHRRKASGTSW